VGVGFRGVFFWRLGLGRVVKSLGPCISVRRKTRLILMDTSRNRLSALIKVEGGVTGQTLD
jgi:hypothetical protein